MTPKDALGLIIRVAGLAFILFAVLDLGHLLAVALGLPLPPARYSSATVLAGAGFWVVLGVLLLASASAIARLLYGRDRSPG